MQDEAAVLLDQVAANLVAVLPGEVVGVGVRAQARRAGVARSLLEAACELARSTGAARLALATAKDNAPAKALYLSLGYRVDEQFDHLELPLGPG